MNELVGNIHSIETFGTLDGPGIRYVLFLQGCQLRCKYCHNRDSWSSSRGKSMTVSEVMEDVEKYREFIEASGGGVTISGGEPTFQLDFIRELLKGLKERGFHTCLDTSGYVDICDVSDMIENVDLIILDLKQMKEDDHIKLTGVSNKKILKFARWVSDVGVDMWVRHVLVPGLTDKYENMISLAEFVSELKTLKQFELLPYHSMGKYKWDQVGEDYKLEGIRDVSSEDISKYDALFKAYGIYLREKVSA